MCAQRALSERCSPDAASLQQLQPWLMPTMVGRYVRQGEPEQICTWQAASRSRANRDQPERLSMGATRRTRGTGVQGYWPQWYAAGICSFLLSQGIETGFLQTLAGGPARAEANSLAH
jgi:hypothetical protein